MRARELFLLLALSTSATVAVMPGGVTGMELKPTVLKNGKSLLFPNRQHALGGHIVAVIGSDPNDYHKVWLITPDARWSELSVPNLNRNGTHSLTVQELPNHRSPALLSMVVNGGKGAAPDAPLTLTLSSPPRGLFAPELDITVQMLQNDFRDRAQQLLHQDLLASNLSAWDEVHKQLVVYFTGATLKAPKKPVVAGRYRVDAQARIIQKQIGPL
ncbi:MAG: hypothetical protein ACYCW6_19075 [Candidatus Xenobia bacterium]